MAKPGILRSLLMTAAALIIYTCASSALASQSYFVALELGTRRQFPIGSIDKNWLLFVNDPHIASSSIERGPSGKFELTVSALSEGKTQAHIARGGQILMINIRVYSHKSERRLQNISASQSSGLLSANKPYDVRKNEIISKWAGLKPAFDQSENPYDSRPSSQAPYTPGKLDENFLKDGVNMLNFMRFLSDLPSDIQLLEELNLDCQYGAVLVAANGAIDHRPHKPTDMAPEFYSIAVRTTQKSNLAQNSFHRPSLTRAVESFMDDSDPDNIEKLGHRRWILNPTMQFSGIGFAQGKSARFGPNGMNFVTLYAFDMSRELRQTNEAILWPNGSAFPQEFFSGDTAWSVALNPDIYLNPSAKSVSVAIRHKKSGRIWRLDSSCKSKTGDYFNISNARCGSGVCIIFRPGGIALYSGRYDVSISGLRRKDGVETELNYSVEFFDLY